MTGYILSPRARGDIEDIWNYTATNWGIDQAELYIRESRQLSSLSLLILEKAARVTRFALAITNTLSDHISFFTGW
jgi:hypothetical protein